jgi:hypothetical protein
MAERVDMVRAAKWCRLAGYSARIVVGARISRIEVSTGDGLHVMLIAHDGMVATSAVTSLLQAAGVLELAEATCLASR